jgi:hypothetical protein
MPSLGVAGVSCGAGRVEPRFLNLSVGKESAQATGRVETAGVKARQSLD